MKFVIITSIIALPFAPPFALCFAVVGLLIVIASRLGKAPAPTTAAPSCMPEVDHSGSDRMAETLKALRAG